MRFERVVSTRLDNVNVAFLALEWSFQRLSSAEEGSVKREIAIHRCRTLCFPDQLYALFPHGRHDLDPSISLFVVGEMTGKVFGLEARCFGERPDLEEVDGLVGSVAFFGVGDAGSGGCHLEVAPFEDFEVAHGVFTVFFNIGLIIFFLL